MRIIYSCHLQEWSLYEHEINIHNTDDVFYHFPITSFPVSSVEVCIFKIDEGSQIFIIEHYSL